jgi:hypothetical protein
MAESPIPRDPLSRFLELAHALEDRRRWWQGSSFLRYAAATLTTTAGRAADVAAAVIAEAEELRRRAGWFGSLQSDARFVVAAMLVRAGREAAPFHDAIARGQQLFRQAGLRRGATHEILALLVLWLGREGRIRAEDVRHLKAVIAGMAEHHPWLTGADDFPAAALLALRGEPVVRQMVRIERFYRALIAGGLGRDGRLQLLSHLLYFNPAADETVLRRFWALRERFVKRGVHMWTADFDELALLTFVDAPAGAVVGKVLEHRAAMRDLRPRPDALLSFSLACGTAFLELLGPGAGTEAVDAGTLANVQQILAAQQAAIIAASSGAVVAASASSH